MTSTPSPALSSADYARGLLFLLAAVLGFGLIDATAKYLTGTLPAPQVVWARFSFHLLVALIFWLLGRGAAKPEMRRLPQQIACSLFLFGASFLFYSALSHLPLAETTAVYYVSPVILTALSALLLREHVGPRRWIAVGAGFIGVLIIVRPGGAVFHWAALLAVGAAFCFPLYQITVRSISREVSPASAMFFAPLVGALVMSVVVPFGWVVPGAGEWALMIAIGILGYFSQFLLFRALQHVPASVTAPYGYLDVVLAAIFGYALFGAFPDGLTILGIGIVVAAGLYIFYRERRLNAGRVSPERPP